MSFRQFSTIVEKYNYSIVKNRWKSHNFQFWKGGLKNTGKPEKKGMLIFPQFPEFI